MDRITYHGQIPLKGQEELLLTEVPISFHVSWKEKRLLQGLSNMTCLPPLVVPNQGIPSHRDTIYLQLNRPYARCMAHLSHERILSALNRGRPFASLVLRYSLVFVSLGKVYLAFLRSFVLSLSPQLRIWLQPKICRELRRGRRRIHWGFWTCWLLEGQTPCSFPS